MRILYIYRGTVPPRKDERLEQFVYLSESVQGDVLLPVRWATTEEAQAEIGPQSFPIHTVAGFRYHLFLAGPVNTFRQRLGIFRFYLREGRRIHRENRFDCIITYGHSMTAIAGLFVKWMTGAKLIVEINTEPGRVYLFNSFKPVIVRRLKSLYSVFCLHLTAWLSDRLRLLYPEQIRAYPLLRRVRVSVFHCFVPLAMIPAEREAGAYVLLVGAPWYLKGVDVLIKAFHALSPEFPDVKLVIQGYYPDRREIERLISGCSQIEVQGPRSYPDTLDSISKALVVIHPSRTDGLPRVLEEAMAAGRPCLATTVGGIPHYIRHGHNGLLVPPDDVEALTGQLRRLLSDPALRASLGRNAREFASRTLSEKAYVKEFVEMLSLTVAQ